MNYNYTGKIKNEHASLPGHFPGNPVVPGVVLLDQVRMAVADWRPGYFISGLPQVKFSVPLLPDQEFKIMLTEKQGKYSFSCIRDDETIAQGQFKLEQKSEIVADSEINL